MTEAYLGERGHLIRYSAIVKALEAKGMHDLIVKLKADISQAGRACDLHGQLTDPIIGVEMAKQCIIVACPWCSSDVVRSLWESQGPEAS